MAELICKRTDLEEEKFTDFTNFELDVKNDNKHGDWSTLRDFDAGYISARDFYWEKHIVSSYSF